MLTDLYIQWRSDAQCRPDLTVKVPPFPTLKFGYKNLKDRRLCFVLSKDIRNIKPLDLQKHSQTEMVLIFHSRLWVVLFLLVHHLSHHLLFCFSAFFTVHLHSWTLHISLKWSSPWLSVCAKLHHSALIVCTFQGIKQKCKKCVIAAPDWRNDAGIPMSQFIYAFIPGITPSLPKTKYMYCI